MKQIARTKGSKSIFQMSAIRKIRTTDRVRRPMCDVVRDETEHQRRLQRRRKKATIWTLESHTRLK